MGYIQDYNMKGRKRKGRKRLAERFTEPELEKVKESKRERKNQQARESKRRRRALGKTTEGEQDIGVNDIIDEPMLDTGVDQPHE